MSRERACHSEGEDQVKVIFIVGSVWGTNTYFKKIGLSKEIELLKMAVLDFELIHYLG